MTRTHARTTHTVVPSATLMEQHVQFCMETTRMRVDQSWKCAEEEKKGWRGRGIVDCMDWSNGEELPLWYGEVEV